MTLLVVEHPGRGRTQAFRALDRVSLSLGTRQVLGVVGGSGSGTTTWARTASGQPRPPVGSVRVDGIDLAGAPGAELRRPRGRVGVGHVRGVPPVLADRQHACAAALDAGWSTPQARGPRSAGLSHGGRRLLLGKEYG